MGRTWLRLTAFPVVGALAAAVGLAQKPADPPANKDEIEAAFRLTRAAAAEYEFRVGGEKQKPLDLRRDPALTWSNPEAGQVYGNVFLWTREGRPLVVSCLFNWFVPRAVMEHEFHSLAEEPLAATFHGDPVWKTSEAGVRFADVPNAPAPAANEAQRLVQLKQLAKEFSGTGKFRMSPGVLDLRLLPQPLYRYAVPKEGVLTGGLFAFVRSTDPEIVLLIEARGKDAASARWRFAAVRMHSVAELRLKHSDRSVWEAEPIAWKDVYESHERPYTSFRFKETPDFLKDALAKPKP